MEEERIRQIEELKEKERHLAEQERQKALKRKNDSRSIWAKYIDLCLEREDIFKMSKDSFNETFGIVEPENVRKVSNVKKMSDSQKEVLQELYSFSAYIKRDINNEGRMLRRDLDLNENKLLQDQKEAVSEESESDGYDNYDDDFSD